MRRQNRHLVKIIAFAAVLRAIPANRRIVARVEPPRAGDDVAVRGLRQSKKPVDIEIIDALARIVPARTAIAADGNAAVLDRKKDVSGIVRANEDLGDMPLMRRERKRRGSSASSAWRTSCSGTDCMSSIPAPSPWPYARTISCDL